MVTFPLCFTPRIFELWRSSRVAAASNTDFVCRDCLPAYQLRMKKLGRCERPEVMFTLDEEGGIVGRA